MFIIKDDKLTTFVRRHFATLAGFLTVRKSLNVIRALVEMRMRRTVCRSWPFMYRIDPCTLCNLKCPACETPRTTTREKRLMDMTDFETIIEKIKPYALRASLYDMGEPLMHRQIYDMIRFATDNKISTLISTNFNLFAPGDIDALFGSGLTVLEPCLDGFTQESYEKYRKGGQVDIVKRGIEMVMEEKRKRRSPLPVVDVQVVLFDHIQHEIKQLEQFLRQCRVDKVTYRQENLGFNDESTTTANKAKATGSCYWLYLGMMIRPDGNVYPCCGRDFDRFSYGNILKQSLEEIWNNKYYRFSRELFARPGKIEIPTDMKEVPCITCPRRPR